MGICNNKAEDLEDQELQFGIGRNNSDAGVQKGEGNEEIPIEVARGGMTQLPQTEDHQLPEEDQLLPQQEGEKDYITEVINVFDERIKEHGRVSNEEALNEAIPESIKRIEEENQEFLRGYLLDTTTLDYDRTKLFHKGVIHFEDESFYNGTWNLNLKKHGKGVFIKTDGSKYVGDFFDDKIEGRGYYIDTKGNIYKGMFKEEQANGTGEVIHNEVKNYSYIGGFVHNKMHGFGEETLPNGTVYQGQFNMGEKEGNGKIKFNDGSEYEGEFSKGDINGRGIYKWPDGKVYEGDFVNNKTNGKGKTTWTDGSYYEGYYKNDQREGQGIHYIPEGKYYIGFWLNSLFHGVGTYKDNNTEYKGLWRYGKKIKQF